MICFILDVFEVFFHLKTGVLVIGICGVLKCVPADNMDDFTEYLKL